MRIVVGNHGLSGPGGTETYTITVAGQLQRLGHELWIHANDQGPLADQARATGLRVPERPTGLPEDADAVVVNDAITALQLAERYPAAPLVLVGHSDILDLALPPRLPGLLSAAVVLYDRVERRFRGLGLEVPIHRFSQPVDVELFKPLRALPPLAHSVLVLGNYVHGARLQMIERACARAGLECVHVGIHGGGQTLDPVVTLSAHDIVIGKARVIIEAMATGRAAYTLDHNGGDGWVTAESYAQQAADNFGGQSSDLMIDEDRLAADLAEYDAGMGTVNRDLAVRHHAATRHAADLAVLLQGLAPRARPVPAPLDEIARLVRTSWYHEGRAFALYAQVERLEREAHEGRGRQEELRSAIEQLALMQARAEASEFEGARAQARLVELEAQVAELGARLGQTAGGA